MTRQYKIQYHRLGGKAVWLEPLVHKNLYDNPAVNAAVDVLRQNPAFVGIAVQVDTDRFDLFAFNQEAIAPGAILLE